MDLLNGDVRRVYLKYLSAAFCSSCISCVYGLVDTAVVGQYHGPAGTAAISVAMPVFNLIYSLGLLVGIGGSVLYSAEKGRGRREGANAYFTAALLGAVVFSLVSWGAVLALEDPLLRLFGANDALMPLVKKYMLPIKLAVPVFLVNQMLAAFLRNDNDPGRAAAAVLISGVLNIFGDVFFVFGLDLGIVGAAIATVLGTSVSVLIMLTHFLSRKNTLRLVPVGSLLARERELLTTGFATFFVDLSLGIVTMLFNRQIIRHLGTDALSVFGVLMNLNTLVQCCAYSVGQAAQPILSMNYGAARWSRVRKTLGCALCTAAAFGLVWTVLIQAAPNGFIRLFMDPTQAVLDMAPGIMRTYGLAFLLMPLNVFSTYYFQSLMRPGASFTVSVGRGLVLSGGLILLLPTVWGGSAVWLAMPITEVLMFAYVAAMLVKYTRGLPKEINPEE